LETTPIFYRAKKSQQTPFTSPWKSQNENLSKAVQTGSHTKLSHPSRLCKANHFQAFTLFKRISLGVSGQKSMKNETCFFKQKKLS